MTRMGLAELCGPAPAHPDRIPVIPNGELIMRLPRPKFDYQFQGNVKGLFIVQVGSCDVYFRCHAMLYSDGNLVTFLHIVFN